MTARELIVELKKLGEDNLNRKVILFDGPSYFTPYKVCILKDEDWDKLGGNILID